MKQISTFTKKVIKKKGVKNIMHQYHINNKKRSLIHTPPKLEAVVSNCMCDKMVNTKEFFIHCSYPLPRLLSSENHLAVVY
jgi:hypothetical protein